MQDVEWDVISLKLLVEWRMKPGRNEQMRIRTSQQAEVARCSGKDQTKADSVVLQCLPAGFLGSYSLLLMPMHRELVSIPKENVT